MAPRNAEVLWPVIHFLRRGYAARMSTNTINRDVARELMIGDVDYNRHGLNYSQLRRPDPRIAAKIHAALGEARTVVNVGAGAGSYEPTDRTVVAIEPFAAMRAQRPAHLSPAVRATAENLPFDDRSFDAAMACLTIHQWPDKAKGLAEVRRVTRGPIVIMTFDFDALHRFWLMDYAPELAEAERVRLQTIDELKQILAPLATRVRVEPIPIPIDCTDGFTEAYYARPERMVDPAVRAAQSVWNFVPAAVVARFEADLRRDLASGAWDKKYGSIRSEPMFHGSLRLVVAEG